jgi:hypothetical protein
MQNLHFCFTRSSIHISHLFDKNAARNPDHNVVKPQPCRITIPLPIAFSDTLQLVLLLDSIGVAASLSSVDQLFSQALSNRLDVSEGGFTGTNGEEGNGLVDTAERRDIDGLTTDGTGGTNTGAVFTWATVDNSINADLERVLVGHDVDLKKLLVGVKFVQSEGGGLGIQSRRSGQQFGQP